VRAVRRTRPGASGDEARPVVTRPLTRVLVVDPEIPEDDPLIAALDAEGYAVRVVRDGGSGGVQLRLWHPHAVLLELDLPDETALDWLRRCHRDLNHAPVVIVTRHATVARAVEILGEGAFTLLEKPADAPALIRCLRVGLARRAAAADEGTRAALEPGSETFGSLVSRAPGMREAFRVARAAAPTDANILIVGENGTGKELMASAVHEHSLRASHPFIRLNCAAIPAELLESELFGFERGAFTGAIQQKPGKFEFANHGTMFLDEIGDMSPALQAKLLQVLQDGEFSRLGGKQDVHVDVRIIAATNRALERAVADGHFREDLFFRLNVVSITLPPLRERREEIPLLSDYFLKKYSVQYNKAHARLSEETLRLFMEHEWPGNVRELENLVKRVVLLGDEAPIRKDLMAAAATQRVVPPLAAIRPFSAPVPAPPASPAAMAAAAAEAGNYSLKEISRCAAREAERELILKMLTQTRWNRKETAEILGISYKALLYKIKESGLDKAS
jgi:DNA-binding NtrC family response regulator